MSRKARHQRLHSETAQDSGGGRLPYEGVLNPIGLDLAEERVGYHPAAVNHGNERGGPSFGGKNSDEQIGRRRVVVTSGESGGRHHVVLTNGSGESDGRHHVVLTNGSGESDGQHHRDVRSGRTLQSHRQSLADKYGSDERRECPTQAANNDSSEQKGRERLAEKYGSSEQSYEMVQSSDEGEEEEAESGKRSRPRDLMVYYR
jgi:hypothetical protein